MKRITFNTLLKVTGIIALTPFYCFLLAKSFNPFTVFKSDAFWAVSITLWITLIVGLFFAYRQYVKELNWMERE